MYLVPDIFFLEILLCQAHSGTTVFIAGLPDCLLNQKSPFLVNFGGPCVGKSWNILWPFGLFYIRPLEKIMVIWYILWYFVPRKIWQPWFIACLFKMNRTWNIHSFWDWKPFLSLPLGIRLARPIQTTCVECATFSRGTLNKVMREFSWGHNTYTAVKICRGFSLLLESLLAIGALAISIYIIAI
jgi:hypothetical protein